MQVLRSVQRLQGPGGAHLLHFALVRQRGGQLGEVLAGVGVGVRAVGGAAPAPSPLGGFGERLLQSQASRDCERVGLAGGAPQQAVRGAERRGVELDRGVRRAGESGRRLLSFAFAADRRETSRRAAGERLHLLVVAGRHRERGTLRRGAEHRGSERGALRGVRPAARLVQQDHHGVARVPGGGEDAA